MSKVVSLAVARKLKQMDGDELSYRARILKMDKLALLEEMMLFQSQRSELGKLTVDMMVKGQILFKALEDSAETDELRTLARSYRRHLRFELEAAFDKQVSGLE